MDLSSPPRAVVPTLDAQVLQVLAGTTSALTGRQVSRLSGRSQRGTQAVLDRMVEHGLVDAREAGAARLYALNREHVAAGAALALLDLRSVLFERIRGQIAQFPVSPVAAAVFGSAARGDGDPSSDIDMLIVRPDGLDEDDATWAQAVADLAANTRRWSGNHGSVLQLNARQMRELIEREEPIVQQLQRDAIALTPRSVLDVAPALT